LKWINEEYSKLGDADKKRINTIFKDTGCEKLLLNENN
jgi:hypothetical protein